MTIVGVGGVGGWVAEALVRSGVGALRLVDADDVCSTNLNRQVHALRSTIGRSKLHALRQRLVDIQPGVTLHLEPVFLDATNVEDIVQAPTTYLVDAIDDLAEKARLLDAAARHHVPTLVAGGAGGRRDPLALRAAPLGEAHGDPLLRALRRRLRHDHGWSPDHPGWAFPAVFSTEALQPASSNGEGRACEGRYGTSVAVVGALGLAIASTLLGRLAV